MVPMKSLFFWSECAYCTVIDHILPSIWRSTYKKQLHLKRSFEYLSYSTTFTYHNYVFQFMEAW